MPRYIKNFNKHKSMSVSDKQIEDFINEGWLQDTLSKASAGIKAFLGGITAPFKNAMKDFKKGMDYEKIKQSLTNTLDASFKNASKSIDAIKDENDLNKILPDFQTALQQLATQLENEIKNIKESRIFEANIQDTLIGAKVILNSVTKKMTDIKKDFDVAVAKATDLAEKKASIKKQLTDLYNEVKNIIKDLNIEEEITRFKKENNVKVNSDTIVLDWGEVDVELISAEGEAGLNGEKLGNSKYKVLKSYSKKLLTNDIVSISGTIKIGEKVKMSEILRNNKTFKIDGKDFYETGAIESIKVSGKDVQEHNFGGENSDPNDNLKAELVKIKDDPDKMEMVNKLVNNLDNNDKVKQVGEILDKE